MFDFILNNDKFKNMMLGQLQSIFDSGKCECIVVTNNPKENKLDILVFEKEDVHYSDTEAETISNLPGTIKVVLLTTKIKRNANNINTEDGNTKADRRTEPE